jgi:hypothetical protein
VTRLVLTAVIAPPPHRVKNGARQERMSATCEVEDLGALMVHYASVAQRMGVFESGGALTLLVQREPVAH